MTVVMQVSRAMQMVLTSEARRVAIRCGVIQRERKVNGASLVQAWC
jgi:hypothetical protein